MQAYLGVVNHTACAHCGGRDSDGTGRELVPLQHLCMSTLFFLKRDFVAFFLGRKKQPTKQHPVLQVLVFS